MTDNTAQTGPATPVEPVRTTAAVPAVPPPPAPWQQSSSWNQPAAGYDAPGADAQGATAPIAGLPLAAGGAHPAAAGGPNPPSGGAPYPATGGPNPPSGGAPYPAAGGPNPPSGEGHGAGAVPAPRPRRIWPAIVGTAAATAILASGGTAVLTTTLLNRDGSGTSEASLADVGSRTPISVDSITAASWEEVAAAVAPSVVAIEVTTASGGGEGSGVIIDGEGYILTNDHVVTGAENDTVQVTLSDGRLYDATIVGLDSSTDLAVIKITDPPSDLTPATFADSDSVVVGNAVMAVGNPLGLANTVTTGIVSAVSRPVTTSDDSSSTAVVTNAIQIDAAVNPGNSGGPLFNASGEVIGITSSIATLSSGSSQSGSIGLGFAIPSNLASSVGQQLIEDGEAEHAYLGVTLSDATATADGVTRRGAAVQTVNAGSPAADAGIVEGDVIVAIDGAAVNGTESAVATVRERTTGETAKVTIVRDGETKTVTVTFATRPSDEELASQDSSQTPDQDGSSDGQSQDGQSQDEIPGSTNPGDMPDGFFDWYSQQQEQQQGGR
ncbi:MAG: trypsin-like peptidase domain-containing protein [Cellulomonadaceae bacterium]